jgi:hypothetical protein
VAKLKRKRKYILVFLVAALSSTVVLKIADIQYLELIFAADFLVLSFLFMREGLQVDVYRPFFEIGKSYAIFLGVAFLFSILALQQDFSQSFHDSIFKKPVVVTVARMAELFLDVFYMLYLASLYREDKSLCKFGARTYYWVGVAGCAYSLATFPLNVLLGMQLGTYSESHRFRGFNNEGGSFGLYLLSVFILAIAMRRRNWLSRRQFGGGMALLLLGMIGAQSKSLFLAGGLLGAIDLIWLFRGWKRWAMITGMLGMLIAGASLLNFQTQIDAYLRGSDEYQKLSYLKANDGNFVMGRVAGAVLAPRMIAARPLVGVGWGNYPLVRDDPEYRQGTAFAINSSDAPGLGLIDYIVELGIPLWLYLTWVELKPVVMLRRRGADVWLVSLALMQPLSNWAGSHLNLTHPWVVLSFALGLGFHNVSKPAREFGLART